MLLIGCYTYRFLSGIGLYRSIMSWQLTIWSLHASAPLALRMLGLPRPAELLACAAWSAFAWHCRGWQVSLFSLFFLVFEASVSMVELGPRLLSAVSVLQAIIATVAWGGMLAASCSETLTFVPMDRHLHLGLAHLLRSAAAQRCLLHELLSHLIAQALLAALLLFRRLEGLLMLHSVLPDLAGGLAAYTACVLAAASALAPHELPYNLGALPAALRWPLPLPDWLRGDGAVGGLELLRLPWWMQVPEKAAGKEE